MNRARDGQDAMPIDPFWLCYRLDELLPDDSIICNGTAYTKPSSATSSGIVAAEHLFWH
jgi:hypothetical protein